jgi:hypothetical protein
VISGAFSGVFRGLPPGGFQGLRGLDQGLVTNCRELQKHTVDVVPLPNHLAQGTNPGIYVFMKN